MLNSFLSGWEKFEPTIVACVAKGYNLLLLGNHGCGKSSLARFISYAVGEDKNFNKYYMDKENLISMVGVPNPEELKKGNLSYTQHNRSIFNADCIMMDEITRAAKESQNMVLEALEEKTIFGYPLKYEFVIATANDESYKSAFKMDAALLDRFYCVVPVTETNRMTPDRIEEMIRLNLSDRRKDQVAKKEIQQAIEAIRHEYDKLMKNTEIVNKLVEFSSRYFALLLSELDDDIYVSPRQYANQFLKLVTAIGCYYKEVKHSKDYMVKGAEDAIRYSICTKLGVSHKVAMTKFQSLRSILENIEGNIDEIRLALSSGTLNDRIDAYEQYADQVANMPEEDILSIVGSIVEDAWEASEDNEMSEFLRIHKITKKHNVSNKILDRCRYHFISSSTPDSVPSFLIA